MQRILVAAIVVLTCTSASAEELWVIKDGVLNTDGIDYLSSSPNKIAILPASMIDPGR